MLSLPVMINGFRKLTDLAWEHSLKIWLYVVLLSFLIAGGMRECTGQDFNRYQLIQGKAPIPPAFLSISSHIQSSQNRSERFQTDSRRNQLQASSTYYTHQLLQSGKVLFGDSISLYLQDLVNHILRDKPEIRQQIQIYAVRSPSVNAFASHDGIILVNLGLFAQLKNEAELAFILCHEISHYVQGHQLDILLNGQSILQEAQSNFTPSSISNYIQQLKFYSQKKEWEADVLGFELLQQTSYDLQASVTSFDDGVHDLSPFEEQDFPFQILQTNGIQLPEYSFLQSETIPISESSHVFQDTNSTHPSPHKRRELLQELVQKSSNTGRVLWFLGKERFQHLKKIALFEVAHLYLLTQQYESAIFYAGNLLEEEQNSFFLQKIISQSLYGLSKYLNGGRFWDVHEDYEAVHGAKRSLHYLTEHLLPEELNLVALAYLWNLSKEYPSDQELSLMTFDLMKEFAHRYWDEANNQRHLSWIEEEKFWELIHLYHFQPNPAVQRTETIRVEQRKTYMNGINLGLEKVVFVNPSYSSFDLRKSRGESVQFSASKHKQELLIKLIRQHAQEVQLEIELMTPHTLNEINIDRFNDIALLNDWLNEKLSTQGLSLISINHTELQELRTKYDTPYFTWTECISLTQKRNGKLLIGSAGVLFPPILPYSIYYLLTPKHETHFFTLIFDITSGEPILIFPQNIQMKDRSDLLHSITYDLVHQIKQSPEKR